MIDVITYCEGSVKDKLIEDYPDKITVITDDEGKPTGEIRLKVSKIQTERNDSHAVSLIRCEEKDLEWLGDVFEILAKGKCRDGFWYDGLWHDNCPYSKLTQDAIIKKDLAYPREYVDEEGNKQLKPFKFGQFQ